MAKKAKASEKELTAALDVLVAERDRLIDRQAGIERLLAPDGAPGLDEVRVLARERSENGAVIVALGPRIEAARAARDQAQVDAREARALALRPKERAAFGAVVEAAAVLHDRIAALYAVHAELRNELSWPLAGVPAALFDWLTPGPHGHGDSWMRSVDQIDAALR